jgi:hypothetical protein
MPKMLSYEEYQKDARAAGLEYFLDLSWTWYSATPYTSAPEQPYVDLVQAYDAAKILAPKFYQALEEFGKSHGVAVRGRPSQLKDGNRLLEKAAFIQKIPLDILGGTIICNTLVNMYSIMNYINHTFKIVSFRDRLIKPVSSGYRDIQLIIEYKSHLIELKIAHRWFQEIDKYEHKTYEIQRSIEARFKGSEVIPWAETFVKQELSLASQRMYTSVWSLIFDQEGAKDENE